MLKRKNEERDMLLSHQSTFSSVLNQQYARLEGLEVIQPSQATGCGNFE
jgi:hypothetical protein